MPSDGVAVPVLPVYEQLKRHLDRNWAIIDGEILRHQVRISGCKLDPLLSIGNWTGCQGRNQDSHLNQVAHTPPARNDHTPPKAPSKAQSGSVDAILWEAPLEICGGIQPQ